MNTEMGRAGQRSTAGLNVTAQKPPAARASLVLDARPAATAEADTINKIRLLYRRAKAAEQARIRIDLGLYAYARVFLSSWAPDDEAPSRAKAAAQAKRIVDTIRAAKPPAEGDADMHAGMAGMVLAAEPSRQAFEKARKEHRRDAEKLVAQMPGWAYIKHVKGFSSWGLATIIGEAGDIGAYSGCRKLYKRLGLAPDECYPTGEKKTGRKIPRNSRGRIMGIIADPLFRAQWRGAKSDDDRNGCQRSVDGHPRHDPVSTIIPAHAIGPFGTVYGTAKVRHLGAGKTKGHAEKAARRAMVKALLHDVHDAWHGRPLTYAKAA